VNAGAHSAVEEDDALADELEECRSHGHGHLSGEKSRRLTQMNADQIGFMGFIGTISGRLIHPFIRIHC
jgi:hypothetical protein